MIDAEKQGKFMIMQGKATDLGKEIRDFAKGVGDPTVMYFAGLAMTRLEEVMHRVGDMFKRIDQLTPENIEKLENEALASGQILDMTGKIPQK